METAPGKTGPKETIDWALQEFNLNDELSEDLLMLSRSLLTSFAEKLERTSGFCLADLDPELIENCLAENATDDASSDRESEPDSAMTDRADRAQAAGAMAEVYANADNSHHEHDVHSTPLRAVESCREIPTTLAQHVLNVVRDSLVHDEYILQAAAAFNFPEDKRIVRFINNRRAKCLVFFVQKDCFSDWLKRHSVCIGTKFTKRSKAYSFSVDIKGDSTQSKKDRAGQIIYRFSCHRKSQPYRDKNQVKGGKSGKPRVRQPSIRSGCKAAINATFRPKETSDGLPGDCYKVEYHFEHNHKLGFQENMDTVRKSDAIRRRIKTMLTREMSVHAIMNHLTADHARLTRLLEGDNTPTGSCDDFITYKDVYNTLHAIIAKEVKKNPDDVKSAKLWMVELEKNNYLTFYDKTHGRYFGFSSPWQLDQLRQWGDVLYFDGIHNVRGGDTYLFTIIVRNKETGFGVPVAFLVTKHQQWELLKEWLAQLKAKLDLRCNKPYFPTAVITDQGENEISALLKVFNFKTRVFFCAWHIQHSWERWLSNTNCLESANLSTPGRNDRGDKVRQQLSAILYAKDEQEANHLLEQFRNDWSPIVPDFIQYLDKNYFMREADRRRWMFCYRQEVCHGYINASNFIESWHNTLEKYFVKNKHERRLDSVIHILVEKVILHFQLMCIRHTIQVGKMTDGRRQALNAQAAAIDHIENTRLQDSRRLLLLHPIVDSVIKVHSFTTPGIAYDITVNWDSEWPRRFQRCSCPHFSKTGAICKHIALVKIAFPDADFRPTVFLEVHADWLLAEPAEDILEIEHVPEAEHVETEHVPEVDDVAEAERVCEAEHVTETEHAPESEDIPELRHALEPDPTVMKDDGEDLHSIINSFTQRLKNMDPDKKIPNFDEIFNILKRGLELLDAGLPVQTECAPRNKRKRRSS